MSSNSPLPSRTFVTQWRDALQIGDKQIDAQHKRLFELVKKLDHIHIETTLSALKDYVVTHFQNEQDLMHSLAYPHSAPHTDLHEDFKKSFELMCAQDAPWTEARVRDLQRFLNRWLIGHIGTHDQRIGEWIRETQPPHHGDGNPPSKLKPPRSALCVACARIRAKLPGWIRNPGS